MTWRTGLDLAKLQLALKRILLAEDAGHAFAVEEGSELAIMLDEMRRFISGDLGAGQFRGADFDVALFSMIGERDVEMAVTAPAAPCTATASPLSLRWSEAGPLISSVLSTLPSTASTTVTLLRMVGHQHAPGRFLRPGDA